MATFTVKGAIIEYLILKYAKNEAQIPKSIIIREYSTYLPNVPPLTYRILNGHIADLTTSNKLKEVEAGEYVVTPTGIEMLLRRRQWLKHWIIKHEEKLGMVNSVLVRHEIDKEEADSGPNLSMVIDQTDPYSDLGSVSQHFDEEIDKLVNIREDKLPELQEMYETLKFCKAELESLRKDMDNLKKRANKSFETIFHMLQPTTKLENSDQSDNTVDSNDSVPYPEGQPIQPQPEGALAE